FFTVIRFWSSTSFSFLRVNLAPADDATVFCVGYDFGVRQGTVAIFPAESGAALCRIQLEKLMRAQTANGEGGACPVRPLDTPCAKVGQVVAAPFRFFSSRRRFVCVRHNHNPTLVFTHKRVEKITEEGGDIFLRG